MKSFPFPHWQHAGTFMNFKSQKMEENWRILFYGRVLKTWHQLAVHHNFRFQSLIYEMWIHDDWKLRSVRSFIVIHFHFDEFIMQTENFSAVIWSNRFSFSLCFTRKILFVNWRVNFLILFSFACDNFCLWTKSFCCVHFLPFGMCICVSCHWNFAI
jgi:hypothetical protein